MPVRFAPVSSMEKLTVMIVDDSSVVRNALAQVLSTLRGVELIGHAGDGEEGIRRVRQLRPAVVILDLHMPRLGGLEAAKAIKALADPPLIIMFSNDSRPFSRKLCLAAGADFFYDKTFEFEAMAVTLKKLVAYCELKGVPVAELALAR